MGRVDWVVTLRHVEFFRSTVVCKRAEFNPVLLLKIKKLTHYVAALHLSTNRFN